jgi:tetratricopeptide (TPR) repeat protein
MKKIFFLTIIILIINQLTTLSQQEKIDDPTTWKYFTVDINAKDNSFFLQLAKEMYFGLDEIQEPDYEIRYPDEYYKMGCRYKMVVNIRDTNPQNQYIIFGNYKRKDLTKDAKAYRFAWSQLSTKAQNFLLSRNGVNKKWENDTAKNELKKSNVDNINPRTWLYFKILAMTDDDSIFSILQDNLEISPKLSSYTIVVNIEDPNPQNQYLVLGDQLDPSSQRFAWTQLSKKVQNGLINWIGFNKENLNIYLEDMPVLNLAIELYVNSHNIYYVYYLRGIAYRGLGKLDDALTDFNRSIELYTHFAKSYFERGNLYEFKNNYKDAITDFNKSIELNPNYSRFYEERGLTYYYSKKYKESISDLEKAIQLKPSSESSLRQFINYAKDRLK